MSSKKEARVWRWKATVGGTRADRALSEAWEAGEGDWPEGVERPVLSRSQIQRLIEEGKVTHGGKPIKANVKFEPGTEIQIEIPPPRSMEVVPENRPLEILYQDEHLVFVNKPPGLTVHPSETQTEGTLVHALLYHVKDLSGIGGVLRPGIVHRIDKDTSGVLVITKTDAAHQELSRTFSEHKIERRYWALCFGTLDQQENKIESLIGRNPAERKMMSMNVKEGRHAVTWARLQEAYALPGKAPFASLVEAQLETGRTHQVRVHLTGIGHSILGDPVYGVPSERNTKWVALPADVREAVRALPGQALHARVLGFRHPITGKDLRIEAEPPAEFSRLLETLRKYR